MSYSPPRSTFESQNVALHISEFALERSRMLDEFARFEIKACTCLARFSGDCDARKPLGQRLADLSKLQPSPSLSKEQARKLANLAVSCEALLRMRASLVHSAMEIGRRDSEEVAMFRNVVDAARETPIYLVMSRADFSTSLDKLRTLTREFEKFLTPSSPPPPKPA